MDYKKTYNQIIERAKNRKLTCYIEKHHIIPKCMGGSDEIENIAVLTAREHFLCHMLLCEMHPKNNKLKHALFLMAIGKQKVKEKSYVVGARVYARLRGEHSQMLTGKKQSQATKDKKSKAMKGHPMFTQDWKDKISKSNQGREIKWGGKFGESLKGRKMPWRTKIVSQYTLDGKWVRDWESVAEISRQSNYGYVGACVNGRQKTAYGYIWKHKKK